MEQINKYRSSIVLGLLLMFLILFAFYMLAIHPANSDLNSRNVELSQLQQEQALLENKISELSGAGTVSQDQEQAMAAITQGDDTEGLILDLQRISKSTYASVRDISFSLADASNIAAWTGIKPALLAGLKEVKMTATVEGYYAEIHEWLKQLNELPRIISIDSFNFQQPYELRTPQKPGSVLTATVSFTAFYEDIQQTEAAQIGQQ
ncbi:hypothetical protein [Paenibacillus sp. S150]|uniref:hypothetical protein n=1 Tax=Paenibacillus sp. S150 TaxID=2749826 RepID=UPI001C56F13E|nr:hypothetical protein [Paenibacillus sp. S150]MBW4081628.1 type II secretion system protein M [Paenibacillus sp. S150]